MRGGFANLLPGVRRPLELHVVDVNAGSVGQRRIKNKPAGTRRCAIGQREGEDDFVPNAAFDGADTCVIPLNPRLAGIAVHQPDTNNI